MSAWLRHEARRLATAATFLTRLPWVARWAASEPEELGRSAGWFPLIGIVIGGVGGLVYLGTSALFPSQLAALLALAAMVLLTGAFHEDGWADTFDGLFGGHTPAQRLEIMQDSRLGTYGALALAFLLLSKWQALADQDPGQAVFVLMAAHAIARWSTLVLALALPYARAQSAMKPVVTGIGSRELAIGTAVTLVALFGVGVVLGPWFTANGLALTAAIVVGAAALYRRRLGGVTGDALGAANQATEVTWLLLAAASSGG